MKFEWHIFPGFTTLQLVQEVQKLMNNKGEPEQFQGRIIFMSMFNVIIQRIKDNEKECIANSTHVSLFAERFPVGRWSFLGPGTKTKWYSTYNERLGGEWDKVVDLMMIKFGKSGHPVFPSHESIVSRNAQKQRRWTIICTLPCQGRFDCNNFRTIISISSVSTEQSQICVKSVVVVNQEQGDLLW